MKKTDLSKSCNDQGIPQQDFDQICKACRNPECTRAGSVESPWTQRMKEQVDRLLINPKFGDPKNPKYADLSPLPTVPVQWSNTPVPKGGIMLGGPPPNTEDKGEPADPWAVPKKPKNLVRVGATVKMGDKDS